ncbi:hypothetical protein GGQ95_001239 [Anoxybacillus rupiensis]|nr:hypothetical protein [Anoxybacillus rupiensis]
MVLCPPYFILRHWLYSLFTKCLFSIPTDVVERMMRQMIVDIIKMDVVDNLENTDGSVFFLFIR